MAMLLGLPVMAVEGPPDLTKGETTGGDRKETYLNVRGQAGIIKVPLTPERSVECCGISSSRSHYQEKAGGGCAGSHATSRNPEPGPRPPGRRTAQNSA